MEPSIEDTRHLLDKQIYSITTIQDFHEKDPQAFRARLSSISRSFENRGISIIVASLITIFITLILLTFIYITTFSTTSIYLYELDEISLNSVEKSTWETFYDIPEEIPVLELHPKVYDFSTPCSQTKFALVLYFEDPLPQEFETWISKCGQQVSYFRINGDPEVEDIERIIKFVPTAIYIPIKAVLNVVKDDNLLYDPELKTKVEFEGNIISSLTISGYLTPEDIRAILDIVPFVEELTIQGPSVCSSLGNNKPGKLLQKNSCTITWPELKTIKIEEAGECLQTYMLVSNCWDLPKVRSLGITGSLINDKNSPYIENLIDKYRIMNVNFRKNICSENVQRNMAYFCT